MTLFVLMIAALHTLPVLWVGLSTRSLGKARLAAIVTAGVGVATGNPAYMFIDFCAVGLAYWFVHVRLAPPKTQPALPAAPVEAAQGERRLGKKVHLIWGGGLLAIFAYGHFDEPAPVRQPASSRPSVIQGSEQTAMASQHFSGSVPEARADRAPDGKLKGAGAVRSGNDMRHCLSLATNAEVARCAGSP